MLMYATAAAAVPIFISAPTPPPSVLMRQSQQLVRSINPLATLPALLKVHHSTAIADQVSATDYYCPLTLSPIPLAPPIEMRQFDPAVY